MYSYWRLLGVLIVGCCALVQPVAAQSGLAPVVVQPAVRLTLTTPIDAVGDLYAREKVDITPQVAKPITRLHFNDGDRVSKGQLLVELHSSAERAELNAIQVDLKEAVRQLERLQALVKSNAVAESDLDSQRFRVDSLRAQVAAAEVALANLSLYAPFTGQLGLRHISEGAFVTPGTAIVTLVDDRELKLDFSIPSIYVAKLKPGMRVTARTQATGSQVFEGKLASLEASVDVATRTLRARALFDNAAGALKSGMLMRLTLATAPREAVMISEAALVPLGGDNFVFVLHNQDGKAQVLRRKVIVGERRDGAVEILDGLSESDKVVTHGLQRIRDGQAVTVQREAAPVALNHQPTH